jgi:hypothetical protein
LDARKESKNGRTDTFPFSFLIDHDAMNLRSPFWYFACLLSLLFGFGLIVSKSRTRVDDVFLLPSLKLAQNVVWDAIVLERRGEGGNVETVRFARNDKSWYLQENDQSIKVLGSVVDNKLLTPMQNLRHDSFIVSSPNLEEHGLDKPRVTVTVKGRPEIAGKTGGQREWKAYLGKESVDGQHVFVSTSDRPDRAYAVPKKSVDGYFFQSTADLRSKRLFDFGVTDPGLVGIFLKEGAKQMRLKRTEDAPWSFEEPPLGLAEQGSAGGGVRDLLNDIVHIAVAKEADFLPADPANAAKFDLGETTAPIRIQTETKRDKGLDVETLLVGKAEGEYYYGRLAGDDGVFKLEKKLLEPVLRVIASPGQLRSRVILPPEIVLSARRIVMTRGKEQATLRFDDTNWHITMPGQSETLANQAIAKKLLAAIEGRPEIERFIEDPKITDASLGLDTPRATLAFFAHGKPDKDAAKEAPSVTLVLGAKEEKGSLFCKRTLQSGDVSRFAIPVAVADRLLANTFLPLANPDLPPVDIDRIVRINADIAGRTLEFSRKEGNWQMTTAAEPNPQPADNTIVTRDLADRFGYLKVLRWLKEVDAKTDLAPLGLAKPEVVVRLVVKKMPKDEAKDKKDESKDATETIEIKLSKEMDVAGEGSVVHGMDSRKPRVVFLASADLVKSLRGTNFEDRDLVRRTWPRILGTLWALPATPSLWASPLAGGDVTRVAPERVKELKITVRGKFETRQFHFARQDKTWIDKSGLQGFQLDPAKVDNAARIVTQPKVFAIVGLDGNALKLYKLKPDEAVLMLQATLDDGEPLSLTVGATFGQVRFAVSSHWPEAILSIDSALLDPFLEGPAYFSAPAAQ